MGAGEVKRHRMADGWTGGRAGGRVRSMTTTGGAQGRRTAHIHARQVFAQQTPFHTICTCAIPPLTPCTRPRPQMYVWYGRTCKPHERPRARDVAGRYLAATGRALAPGALVEVEAGQEPPFFTCHFRGWDAGPVATIADPYEEKLKAMALKEQEKDKAAEGQGA